MEVIKNGRTHLLPECRLNEYCALINVEAYRKNTIPNGTIGCYGGSWGGADLGTVWSYEINKRGYEFKPIILEDYVIHSVFDETKSGTSSYTKEEHYWKSEENARKYIEENFYPLKFTSYVTIMTIYDSVRRNIKLTIGKIIAKLQKK